MESYLKNIQHLDKEFKTYKIRNTFMRITLLFLMVLMCISCKKNDKTESLPPSVSSIKIENSESNIALGKTLQLKPSHLPGNAAKPEYEWSSSNNNILYVESGTVYARALGSATITAKIKNSDIYAEYRLTVVPDAILIINLDKTQIKLTVNEQEKITPSILPLAAQGATVKWTSSNPSVAQVTSAGLVSALSPGNAVITAASEDGKVTAKSNVEVIPEVLYSSQIFTKIKSELLDALILYNEQQGKSLSQELKAGKTGYIVMAKSAIEDTYITTTPGYVEAMFSNLKMPAGDVLKINSNFYMELFPNTSRMGVLLLEINFLQKNWEIKGTRTKVYSFKYSDNVTLAELKAIIDENIADVRRYVNTGSY